MIPCESSVFCRMASKKGFAAGRPASAFDAEEGPAGGSERPLGAALPNDGILFVLPPVVLERLKADMGRCRVRRTPRGTEEDGEGAAEDEPSSGSGEGEGGSEVTRSR